MWFVVKIEDTLANIIMITYLLSKRLGISFSEIDYKIKEKIRIGIKGKRKSIEVGITSILFLFLWYTILEHIFEFGRCSYLKNGQSNYPHNRIVRC